MGVSYAGVYAIVQAVVLRPLPIANQDRVVLLWQRDDRRAVPVVEVAYNDMIDWRARSRSLDELAVVGAVNWGLGIVGATDVQTIPISGVSSSFFRVVGTPPIVGRALEAGDDNGQTARAMVISHGLWQRRFGGRSDALNAPIQIKLNADAPAQPIQIVGVMPRDFDFPRGADAWVPAAPLVHTFSANFGGADNALAYLGVFYGLGKVKAGVPIGEMAAELTGVLRTTEKKSGSEPMERAAAQRARLCDVAQGCDSCGAGLRGGTRARLDRAGSRGVGIVAAVKLDENVPDSVNLAPPRDCH